MACSPTSSPGLRPRSSSSTLPNRFPSRQSTRIITPAKIHGNYIRTSNDNCQSSRQGTQDTSEINLGPSTQNTPIKKRRKQVSGPSTRTISQSSKSRKRPTVSKQNADKHQRVENPEFNQGLTSESDPDEDTRFMDLTQNLDQENAKITAKAQSKKTRGDILSKFDCINLYFFPPDYDKDQVSCFKFLSHFSSRFDESILFFIDYRTKALLQMQMVLAHIQEGTAYQIQPIQTS
jgi:hypothetical protein